MTVEAEPFAQELARAAGLDLGAYRQEHVSERVRRALDREGVRDVAALAALVRSDAAARSRFRRSIAVSVSGPFRDPAQFDLLQHELLPPIVAGGGRIRVWSAGCADGSELCSVAIVLARLGAVERSFLLGSDVLDENLQAAEASAEVLARDVRAHIRWERRDLVRDGAPPGKWTLVLCRNLAIYLNRKAKQSLHELLAGALAANGILLLGRSERLSEPRALGLERVGPHAYRKVL